MTDPKAELKRCDLKKQSQFAGGQIDRMLVITRVYGDLDNLRQRKNKAKQSQFVRSAFCGLRKDDA